MTYPNPDPAFAAVNVVPESDAADDRRTADEMSLIASILANPDCLDEVSKLVSFDSFEDPMSMLAYSAVTEIKERGAPLTRTAARTAMMDKWMHNSDVSAYVRQLNLRGSTAGNPLELAKQVRSYAYDRRVRIAARRLALRADVNDRPGMLASYTDLQVLLAGLEPLTPGKRLEWVDPSPPTGTALYRWFDTEGQLLYIGISGNLSSRQDSHSVGSSWSDFAADCQVVRYPTRELALAAEKAAIKAECPVFNKVHNDSRAAQQRLVEYLISHGRTDLLTVAISRG